MPGLGRIYGIPPKTIVFREEEMRRMREKIAALCHEQWVGWMRYLFSKCTFDRDGSAIIPAVYVLRWTRQLRTKYEDLLPGEQDSDRREADKFLEAFGLDPAVTQELKRGPDE